MWRLRRVARFEVASMAAGMTGLPLRPSEVTGEGVETLVPLSPMATTAERLAYVRAYLGKQPGYGDDLRAAAEALTTDDGTAFVLRHAWLVLAAASAELGWGRDVTQWQGPFEEVGITPEQVNGVDWTSGPLRELLEAACVETGRDVDVVVSAVIARLLAEADTARMADQFHAEEEKLVVRLTQERERAAARTLYSDETLISKVTRAENHLGRELTRALAMLVRLRSLRGEGELADELGSFCADAL